uniref:Uncharacterized protein n=1 Tax=Urocitellus parryii TaxID=9999 RepID=A0A8D2HQ71_UROPR
MLRISHCESTFTTPLQVGLQAWFATTVSSTTQTPTALTQLVHSCLFTHTAPDCFLQRLRVPIFFFHLDVTSLVVYVHQLSVYLYILSMYSFDV